ncbi:MAG: hypothetical protein Q7J38_11960 [Gallionella sp.]|nr:hypothetical protein [Gallionella sp.]
MESEKAPQFSIQAEIVRLIQAANGQSSCYATPANGECGKTGCAWRSDCFDEARELFPSLQMQQTEVEKSFGIPAEIIKLLQTNEGQEAGVVKLTNSDCRK